MDDFLRGLGLLAFGLSMTWFVTLALGGLVSRRSMAAWVWKRSGMVALGLVAVGLALAVAGLTQGASASGSSLVLFGSLLVMAGLWLLAAI